MNRHCAQLGAVILALAVARYCTAQPSTQLSRPKVIIEYAAIGGFGSFAVSIKPDGSFELSYGDTFHGTLSAERHAEIAASVQDVLKLRRLPRFDPLVMDGVRCSLNWGGVSRTWGPSDDKIPPEILRLTRLMNPEAFQQFAATTRPASQPAGESN